jgi:hypothetical protein
MVLIAIGANVLRLSVGVDGRVVNSAERQALMLIG